EEQLSAEGRGQALCRPGRVTAAPCPVNRLAARRHLPWGCPFVPPSTDASDGSEYRLGLLLRCQLTGPPPEHWHSYESGSRRASEPASGSATPHTPSGLQQVRL